MMELSGKKVAILGAAKSGQAAARLLTHLKAQVRLSEAGGEEKIPEDFRRWLKEEKIPVEVGGHTRPFIEETDLLILSPGVRIDALPVQWAKAKGIPVWGEVELASRFCACPIIAVTGSNGKTTVVTLITELLRQAGKKVLLCGNVGTPFADHVLESKDIQYVVLEISSFQLETIEQFKPHVAVFLNFSQNHLDRHKDLDEYFEAKKRIFLSQDEKDFAVLNALDEKVKGLGPKIRSKAVFFNLPEQIQEYGVKNPDFLAAAAATRLLGVSPDVARRVFADFRGVEHRLEKVRTLNGVEFINDSKATTAEAGRWALENIEKPIIMICGGRDKHIDFSVLKELVRRKVKKMIVIGEAKEKLKKTFSSVIDVEEEPGTLKDAVCRAQKCAVEGDCVLLTPMCASFDMFKNFEERGRIFKEIVSHLS